MATKGTTIFQTTTFGLSAVGWSATRTAIDTLGILFGERDTLVMTAAGATFRPALGLPTFVQWPDSDLQYRAGRVSFAPDGSRFTYQVLRSGQVELVVVNRQSVVQRLALAAGAVHDAGRTAWTVDSRSIIASVVKNPPGPYNAPPYNEYYVGPEMSLVRVSAGASLAIQAQKIVLPFGFFSYVESITPTDEGGRVRLRVVGELVRPYDPNAFGDGLFLTDCNLQSFRTGTLDTGRLEWPLTAYPCEGISRGFVVPGVDASLIRQRPGIAY